MGGIPQNHRRNPHPQVFVVDGKKYGPSGATDDQDIPVTVVDKQHPITKGISDFMIHDETYHKYYTAPDVKVLLKTEPSEERAADRLGEAVRQEPRVLFHARPRPFGLDQPELPANPRQRHPLGGGEERKDQGVRRFSAAKSRRERMRSSRPPSAASTSAAGSSASTARAIWWRSIWPPIGFRSATPISPACSALPHLKRLKLSGSGITERGHSADQFPCRAHRTLAAGRPNRRRRLRATRSTDEPHFSLHPAKFRS